MFRSLVKLAKAADRTCGGMVGIVVGACSGIYLSYYSACDRRSPSRVRNPVSAAFMVVMRLPASVLIAAWQGMLEGLHYGTASALCYPKTMIAMLHEWSQERKIKKQVKISANNSAQLMQQLINSPVIQKIIAGAKIEYALEMEARHEVKLLHSNAIFSRESHDTFIKQLIKQSIIQNRHHNAASQELYDSQYAITVVNRGR